jgi:hypothetical protein
LIEALEDLEAVAKLERGEDELISFDQAVREIEDVQIPKDDS